MEWLRRLWQLLAKTTNTERLTVFVAIVAIVVPYLFPHPPKPPHIPWPTACEPFTSGKSRPIEERYQAIAYQIDNSYTQFNALRDNLNFSEPITFAQRDKFEQETLYPLSVCAKQLVDNLDLPPKIESKLATFVSTQIAYRDLNWEIAHEYADMAIKADRYNHLALIAKAATSLEVFMQKHRFDSRDDVFYDKAKVILEDSIHLLLDSIEVERTQDAHFMLHMLYRLAGRTAATHCQKEEAKRWLSAAKTNAKAASKGVDDKEASENWSEILENLESSVIRFPQSCPP